MKKAKIIASAVLFASLALNSAFAADMTMTTTNSNTKTNVVSTNKATAKKIVVKKVTRKPMVKPSTTTGSIRK